MEIAGLPAKWAESEEIFLQEKDLSKSVMILEGKKTFPETKSDWSRIASHCLVLWNPEPIGQFKKGKFCNTNSSFAHHDMQQPVTCRWIFMIPIEINPWNEGQINTLTALGEWYPFCIIDNGTTALWETYLNDLQLKFNLIVRKLTVRKDKPWRCILRLMEIPSNS